MPRSIFTQSTLIIAFLLPFIISFTNDDPLQPFESFQSNYNQTNYNLLCIENYEDCLKESISVIHKYPLKIQLNHSYTPEETNHHLFISSFYYHIGMIEYYGLLQKSPDLSQGLLNFIIASYCGNSEAQYKLYILIESNIFTEITKMKQFKSLLKTNSQLINIQQTNFYNNFIFNSDEGKSSRAMQFLYSSSLSQYIPAMMTLGNKFHKGYNVAYSCETATKYFKEASYQSIKYKTEKMKRTYYDYVSLIKYEYVESKFTIKNVNVNEKIDYLRMMSLQGDIAAIQNLASVYMIGKDVKQDMTEAFKWYQKGALLNDTECIFNLGEMYLNGWGVDNKNYDEAFRLLTLAASDNYNLAWSSLGIMYYYGYGVEKNSRRAYDYFNLAIKTTPSTSSNPNEKGTITLNVNVADAYYNLITILIEDKNDISPNYAQAYKYANYISQLKHNYGTYFFAMMNQYSIGAFINSCELNIVFFKLVAEKDFHSKWLFDYAFNFYKEGSYRNAILMYIELAEQGFEIAQLNAGIILKNYDIFIDKNFQKHLALKYFTMAAKNNNAYATLMLGDFYHNGYGDLKANYAKAMSYYKKVVNKGTSSNFLNAHAYFNLGLIHNFGKGIEKNVTKANNFYNVSKKMEASAKYPVFVMDYYNTYTEKNITEVIINKIGRITRNILNSKTKMGFIISSILFYCFLIWSLKNQKDL